MHGLMLRRCRPGPAASGRQGVEMIVVVREHTVDDAFDRFPRVRRVVGHVSAWSVDAGNLRPPVFRGTRFTFTPRSSTARFTACTIMSSAVAGRMNATVSPGCATPRPFPWNPILLRASGRTCGTTSSTDAGGLRYDGKRG